MCAMHASVDCGTQMTPRKPLQNAFLLLLVAVLLGTTGYVWLEDYTLGEALYMTIITVTTVGFGEVRQLSGPGRMFTALLILFGLASMALASRALVELSLDNLMNKTSEKRKMKKRISLLRSHYIVCGYGQVGAAAVEQLLEAGVDFVVVEADSKRCEDLRASGFLFIEADALDEETLEHVSVRTARGIMVLLPSVANNLFITLAAREMNPTAHIIARTERNTSDKRLVQAGANSVVCPYRHAGAGIANNMLIATGIRAPTDETLHTSVIERQWIDVHERSPLISQSIQQAATEIGLEIFGIRRNGQDQLCPNPDQALQCGDRLLVASEGPQTGEHASEQPRQLKVLIIDDDPTILRLYTRLLHRAGFIPLTASDGKEALEAMSTERPDVAIIDQMLPIYSGIEICERIRATTPPYDAKLILFTSDEQPETRSRALQAGADEVVLKTSQARKLIDAVVRLTMDRRTSLDRRQQEAERNVGSANQPTALETLSR